MINLNKVTKEEALHLAHVLEQLKTADSLVRGLSSAGVQFSHYHSDGAKEARKWLGTLCKEIANKLEPKKKVK